MFKPRRSNKNGGRTSGKPRSGRPTGGNVGEEQVHPDRPVKRAVITSVEAHIRQQHMYRITLKLEYEAPEDDFHDDGESRSTTDAPANVSENWSEEVDAFIASAFEGAADGEALLTVHEDTLVSLRLLKGKELTADEYVKLKQEEQKEQAYRAALGMLERKARTTAELSRSLKRKGFEKEAIEGCIQRLQERKMVDDAAFAKRFAEQRATNQKKGRRLIRQELLQRGVAKTDVEEAIGELDGQAELESALTLARKRWPNTKGLERERKMKLTGMLLRRGFPPGVVRTAVQQAVSEAGNENEDDEVWFDEDSVDSMDTED